MEIIYDSQFNKDINDKIIALSNECGLLADTVRLLYSRGIDTPQKINKFINAGKQNFHDPFLLGGVKEAVERIKLARLKKESVLVFGDYDADGVSAAALLKKALLDFGIDARVIVPEREEGYGLNLDIIEKFNKEQPIDLIITVDCGISEKENIDILLQKGISVIVTDHHEPPKDLPNCIRINPKQENETYPFSGLCGAGVAFKLATALIGEKANAYLDFVALATVADSMDLIDENRDIVYEGLKIFNSNKIRECFKYLISDNAYKITAQTFGFSIAPKINAGGRMGDVKSVLKFFLTEDENERYDLAVKLNTYNIERQVECEKIYQQAKEKIKRENLAGDKVIMVKDSEWKVGFVGIVASKLVEEFCRPVIVFAEHNGYWKGSARSYNGINLFDGICNASDLLITFGGHAQAAGVSVSEENFYKLKDKLISYVEHRCDNVDYEKKIHVEWQVTKPFTLRFAKELESLEPFGVANSKPLFLIKANKVNSKPMKLGSPHYSFSSEYIDFLHFNGAKDVEVLALPIEKSIIFESNYSVYRGRESVKGTVKNVIADFGDFSSLENYLIQRSLENLNSLDIAEKPKFISNLPKCENDYGTIFAVSDYKNLSFYESLCSLPKYLHYPQNKNFKNAVIFGLDSVIEGYKKVVYLDKPLTFVKGYEESYCTDNLIGYKWIDKISTDRSDMISAFNEICKYIGKDTVQILSEMEGKDDLEKKQIIFAFCVFKELGIFYLSDGVLKKDNKIKSALTNSTVYSKIYTLKGLL
jgi:single-stranded-DNA-specific exonuclease RecJ